MVLMFDISNIFGGVGVVIVLATYFFLQCGKMKVDFSYSLWNVIGSLCIIISLIYHLNIPSLMIEIVWVVISGYGVYSALKNNRTNHEEK
jgi:hypothetical protein